MSSSLVNNKYRITRRIGGGSFGEIYLGVGPSGEKVAVKFEKHGSRCPQLRHEYKVYREVASCHGFCSVHHFGAQDNYNVMVMDLLGPSLEDLFNQCGRRFSLKTCLQIADQMLERVDTFHSRHLIHRDIKPANFVIGTGENRNIVYCVDFGLSKRFRHPKNLQHIPHRDGRSLTGTPRYASINNHLGIEQSRRDDLESIAYVLVYFLKGSLPWQGLKAKNAQKKYRLILEKKQQVSIAQLCAGCPSQFSEFLAYTRALKFDTKPDIPFLRKMFRDLYHSQGCANSGKLWDWDDADADNIVTSSEQATTSNMPNMSTGPSGMSSHLDVGDLGYDGNRVNTAGAVGQGGNWGDMKQSAVPRDTPLNRESRREDSERNEVINRRPHTAGAGRGGDGDNDHVVNSARGMMTYSRNKDNAGGGSSNRWAQQNSSRQPGGVINGVRGKNDAIGRPRSAGVNATNNNSNRPTDRPASGTNNGNSMSYGSLKNRFLSGSRGKSSKLFGLSR